MCDFFVVLINRSRGGKFIHILIILYELSWAAHQVNAVIEMYFTTQ